MMFIITEEDVLFKHYQQKQTFKIVIVTVGPFWVLFVLFDIVTDPVILSACILNEHFVH